MSILKQITPEQLLEFFGDDSPEEIARYMAYNISELAQGFISPEAFLAMHMPEEDE